MDHTESSGRGAKTHNKEGTSKPSSPIQSRFQRIPFADIDLKSILMMLIQLLGLVFHSGRFEDSWWILNLIATKTPQQKETNITTRQEKSSFLTKDYSEPTDGGDLWGQFVDLSEDQGRNRRPGTNRSLFKRKKKKTKWLGMYFFIGQLIRSR